MLSKLGRILTRPAFHQSKAVSQMQPARLFATGNPYGLPDFEYALQTASKGVKSRSKDDWVKQTQAALAANWT
jgi:FAD/FMN-containing dehydrogenase